MDLRSIRRIMSPVGRRVMVMVGRCVLAAIDDGKEVQRLQVGALKDEAHADYERVQEYGFSSVPLPGALGIFVCVAGSRDHGIVVATDDPRYRPRDGAPGDAALYHYKDDPAAAAEDAKHRFTLTERNGVLVGFLRVDELNIDCGGSTLVMDAAGLTITTPKAVVNCDDIHLGAEGGPKVARIGDNVNVGGGSSAGLWPIVEGSDKVSAA